MKYVLTMFYGDMGSYKTACSGVKDALWHINSARDHDGLPHMKLGTLKYLLRGNAKKGVAKLMRYK